MKTIEQLAREATENAPLYGRKEFTFSARELETFRRLAIEDFVAGLEPKAWLGSRLLTCDRELVELKEREGFIFFPLYSL